MELTEAIRSRKSIRGFKADPVPFQTLKEILEIAVRAPSGMNTQPWEITVITGKTIDSIKQGNIDALRSGTGSGRGAAAQPFEGKYRQRQVDLAVQLFNLMGIAREDRAKRAEWMQRGFRFFDAPAAFILSIDESLGESMAVFALGTITQTICLTALNYGLGTCIEDQGIMFPEVVRKFANIPASKKIFTSIAIGYPDWDFPANKIESTREPLEGFVTWCVDE